MAKNLRLYYDLMSQPSRALYILLKLSKTPYEDCKVALRKGEHLSDKYKNEVSRFPQVPCIVDKDGFKLSESVAIVRYLSRTGNRISNTLYPNEVKQRASVDEYLEWQHLNTRLGCGMYFRKKFLEPALLGMEPNEAEIAFSKAHMEKSLDIMENTWLANTDYLCSNSLTVADIFGACEVEQTALANYDPTEGRPKLKAWLNRVRKQCTPYYEEAHKFVNILVEKNKAKL
ncbi:glutathione S-transferase theta-1 [Condylostylus longicornis]|uniref:glutathione S-transferase theta-1 n=1 Tax=Condylostylus longicornis TaxID=2530218 RepID=UPI00244E55DC|nr:glutathione S-transferase theta-1 [Condylostylus longicornis]